MDGWYKLVQNHWLLNGCEVIVKFYNCFFKPLLQSEWIMDSKMDLLILFSIDFNLCSNAVLALNFKPLSHIDIVLHYVFWTNVSIWLMTWIWFALFYILIFLIEYKSTSCIIRNSHSLAFFLSISKQQEQKKDHKTYFCLKFMAFEKIWSKKMLTKVATNIFGNWFISFSENWDWKYGKCCILVL